MCKKKGEVNVVVCAVAVVAFIAIVGGGFFAYKSGMLCKSKQPDPIVTQLTAQVNQAESVAKETKEALEELNKRVEALEQAAGIGAQAMPMSTDAPMPPTDMAPDGNQAPMLPAPGGMEPPVTNVPAQ